MFNILERMKKWYLKKSNTIKIKYKNIKLNFGKFVLEIISQVFKYNLFIYKINMHYLQSKRYITKNNFCECASSF